MAIPTSRTKEQSTIHIDSEKCNGCGLCVDVCADFDLMIRDNKVALSAEPFFGCIGCGHCMAVCPNGAITVNGRFISEADLFNLPEKEEAAKYEPVLSLFHRRRSVREFKEKEVEKELIDKVVEAAKTAPMGLPPSDVGIVIFDTREKMNRFATDYCEMLKSIKWMVSKWFITLMRPFWGKSGDEMFRGFLRPLVLKYISESESGKNVVTYNAPAGIYFYGSPYCDPADPIVAATYAMTAAESLGLGTCMLGGVHPFIQYGKAARKFREKYGIKFKSREGLIVIMGYPRIHYKKGIKRTFANTFRVI